MQCYWLVRCELSTDAKVTEKQYPDGGVSLTFDLQASHSKQVELSTKQDVCLCHFSGSVDLVGIRFRPGGAFRLLDLPTETPPAADWDASQWQLPALRPLQEQLLCTRSDVGRITLLEQWLLQRARVLQLAPGMVQHLLPQLCDTQTSLQTLYQSLALKRRSVERVFRREVALSPAQVRNLHKINTARSQISRYPEYPLTHMAQQCGFYDQAHFIRQFRQVTGETPGAYRRRKRAQNHGSKT